MAGSVPASSLAPVTGAKGDVKGRALFNLDVDIGGGKKGRILVCSGVSPRDMAQEFAQSYGLASAVLPKLEQLILSSTQRHEEKAAARRNVAAAQATM
jgi:hypothetical protein